MVVGIKSGDIDIALENFLKKVHEFFAWIKIDRPTRKQSAANVLRKLDLLNRPLPKVIENLRVDEWEEIHNYFQGVSHHNLSATIEDFESWCATLEAFLLDRLIPRTFEDHTKIDEIIREGEGNADF